MRLTENRKTGLTVADPGVRDENGLEPMDNIFSSPQKPVKNNKANGYSKNANGTISSEEDMDLESASISYGIMERLLTSLQAPFQNLQQSSQKDNNDRVCVYLHRVPNRPSKLSCNHLPEGTPQWAFSPPPLDVLLWSRGCLQYPRQCGENWTFRTTA